MRGLFCLFFLPHFFFLFLPTQMRGLFFPPCFSGCKQQVTYFPLFLLFLFPLVFLDVNTELLTSPCFYSVFPSDERPLFFIDFFPFLPTQMRDLPRDILLEAKQMGFCDKQVAQAVARSVPCSLLWWIASTLFVLCAG